MAALAIILSVLGPALYAVSLLVSRVPRARPLLTAISVALGGMICLADPTGHRSGGISLMTILSVALLAIGALFALFEKTRHAGPTAVFTVSLLWVGFYAVAVVSSVSVDLICKHRNLCSMVPVATEGHRATG